ncbi:hypothetical protein ACFCZT_07860 [Streptomyces sp. NPDC056230]|uniref:hypothetical protein n=1 Tax=Streptomyces sp. NPDC056230 TaxID=3345754 RepID=UPI0035DDAE3E
MALDWDRYTKLADSVARRTAAEYPGFDADDIRQEILLQVMEREATFEKANYVEGQLRKNFKQFANRYCGSERYTYIAHTAEYIYTVMEVRQLFDKAFFRPELWETMPTKDDGVSVTAGGVVVALWDLNEAFNSATPNDQEVIVKRYELEEKLTPAETVRLQRAVDKITRALNNSVVRRQDSAKQHSGPGSRKIGAVAD